MENGEDNLISDSSEDDKSGKVKIIAAVVSSDRNAILIKEDAF